MSNIRRVKIESGAIDSSGDAVVYSRPITGKLLSVQVSYDTNTCTVDLDTDKPVAENLLNLSAANTNAVYYPRVQIHDNTGAGVTYDGSNEVYEPYSISGKVKLTIASGTQDEEVKVYLIVEEY